MTVGSQSPLAIRTHWHISLGELLRILVGTAGVVAVAAYVDRLHADWPAGSFYVSGTKFAVTTLFSTLAGYLACRCFFSAESMEGHVAEILDWCFKTENHERFAGDPPAYALPGG